MSLTEQEISMIQDERKKSSSGMGNLFLPILKEPPFPTSLKVGNVVGYRKMISNGDTPLYLNDRDWQVIGFRHDPKTLRDGLVVVAKKGRIGNIPLKDIIL